LQDYQLGLGSALAFFTKRTNVKFFSVSLDESLPTAREYGEHHLAVYGLVLGMVVMAISLLLFV